MSFDLKLRHEFTNSITEVLQRGTELNTKVMVVRQKEIDNFTLE